MKTLCAALALCALCLTPAAALEYSFGGPEDYLFAEPTSVARYEPEDANVDRSKNAAILPPVFGSASGYLTGTGWELTQDPASPGVYIINNGTGSAATSWTDGVIYPELPAAYYSAPAAAYTAVTGDIFYPDGSLGTLAIPSLGVYVSIFEGTDSAILAKGAGHFAGTSIWSGNVCVAGHNRGVNCYFGDIHTLQTGDRIVLTTALGTRTYAVASVEKVLETDCSRLTDEAVNCVTLFTCVRNESEYRWCVRGIEV